MDRSGAEMDRRVLLEAALACAGCSLLSQALGPSIALAQDPTTGLSYAADQNFPPIEAKYYTKLAGNVVSCSLCANHCSVADGSRGICRVRENHGGTYQSLVHSRAVSTAVDPIEKKPFYHYRPGTTAFSLATAGCNMRCQFCQNWQISQYRPEEVRAIRLPPTQVHTMARAAGAPTIAYTYNEPTVWMEYMLDIAALGHSTGIRSVVVSNGMMEQQPLADLLRHVDAIRFDLKSFRQDYYSRICGGQLAAVQRSIVAVRAAGKWVELIVLIVPTLNDSDAEIRDLCQWVKTALSADVPLHFLRFHPAYRLRNLPSTPIATLERCLQIAKAEGLHYVYLGNVPGHAAENTYCPGCQQPVILRAGLAVTSNRLQNGRCPKCQREIPGVWA